MSLLVTNAIDRLERELNEVGQNAESEDLFLFLNNAVDYLYETYNLPTAKRVTDIALYPGVHEYPLPDGFISPISPRIAGGESQTPYFTRETERDIYTHLGEKSLAIEYDEDTPFLVAVDNTKSQIILNGCDETTGVTISGDGSDLILDDQYFTSGTSSLQFNVSASTGSTTITFALSSSFDLSDIITTARGFFDLFCPRTNTVALTNVKLRIGNDASNYYEWTKTTRYRGQEIKAGWGVIGAQFDQLRLLTQDGDSLTTEDGDTLLLEGTVDETAIDFIQIVITHGTTGVNGIYRIDSIFVSQGAWYELPYYSAYVIQASDNSLKEKITAESDTILLPLRCDGVVIYKALEFLCAERKQESNLANYFMSRAKKAEMTIKSRFPQQTLAKKTFWYPRHNTL